MKFLKLEEKQIYKLCFEKHVSLYLKPNLVEMISLFFNKKKLALRDLIAPVIELLSFSVFRRTLFPLTSCIDTSESGCVVKIRCSGKCKPLLLLAAVVDDFKVFGSEGSADGEILITCLKRSVNSLCAFRMIWINVSALFSLLSQGRHNLCGREESRESEFSIRSSAVDKSVLFVELKIFLQCLKSTTDLQSRQQFKNVPPYFFGVFFINARTLLWTKPPLTPADVFRN